MRFNCDALKEWVESKDIRRYEKLTKWRKKFAWIPVKICKGCCVWLEFYEVKFNGSYEYYRHFRAERSLYEYRTIDKHD